MLGLGDRVFSSSFERGRKRSEARPHAQANMLSRHMAAGTDADPRGSESVVPIGALGSSSPSLDRGASGGAGCDTTTCVFGAAPEPIHREE